VIPTAGTIVDWLITKPIWFFYGAFGYSVISHVIRRQGWQNFDFMRVASQSISVPAAPIGVAFLIAATDSSLFPKIAATSGFELYIGLVALLICYTALGALLGKNS